MKNIFIINAQQEFGFAEGNLNALLVKKMQEQLMTKGFDIKISIVDKDYDVSEEVKKIEWADCVIIQTPVFWMSVPGQFKTYIDEVFSAGSVFCTGDGRTRSDASKKYGSGGLMPDKKYMLSTTWNAPLEAFGQNDQFFDGKDVDDVFMWLHKALQFFAMQPLETFNCYDVMKNPEIENDLLRLESHINQQFS